MLIDPERTLVSVDHDNHGDLFIALSFDSARVCHRRYFYDVLISLGHITR